MAGTSVLAPVAGTIGEIRVAEGATVSTGDILIVQHVTKTETNVTSPTNGKVKLLVAKGAQVNQGDPVAEISS